MYIIDLEFDSKRTSVTQLNNLFGCKMSVHDKPAAATRKSDPELLASGLKRLRKHQTIGAIDQSTRIWIIEYERMCQRDRE